MKDRYFIDTNIWVYAHLKEVDNNKHNSAVSVLETLPKITLIKTIIVILDIS